MNLVVFMHLIWDEIVFVIFHLKITQWPVFWFPIFKDVEHTRTCCVCTKKLCEVDSGRNTYPVGHSL